MKILFLDLSTKSTGWCIGEDGKLLEYGCISSTSANVLKRISKMTDGISLLIDQFDVPKIVAEEVRTDYKNVHTYKMLTWIQGIIVYTAFKLNPNIEYEFIQASTWRSSIGIQIGRGIKRDTLKQEDIRYVQKKYGIQANDDVCDAICLMDAYYAQRAPADGISWS